MNSICVFLDIIYGGVGTEEANVGNGQTLLALAMPSRLSASMISVRYFLFARRMKNQ